MIRRELLISVLLALVVQCLAEEVHGPPPEPPPRPAFLRQRFPGDGPVHVCLVTYEPFAFMTTTPTGAVPAGVYTSENSSDIAGYDVELLELIFGLENGLDKRGIVWKFFPTRRLEWIALRNGECDFAASGITQTDIRQDCTERCKQAPIGPPDLSLPPDLQRLDYQNETCCLDFSVPTKASSFSLLSKVKKKYSDIVGLIFNIPVLNVVSTLITSTFCLSFLLYVICCLNTIFSWTLLSSVITSSAVLESGFVVTDTINSFADLGRGALCVETNYQLAYLFVKSLNRSRAAKIDMREGDFQECFRGVANGTFKSFLTDGPILRWEIEKGGRTDMSAVDLNSEIFYGFAFDRTQKLKREAMSTLLLRLTSDVRTEATSARLREKYFPAVTPLPSSVQLQTPSLISMCVGSFVAIMLVIRTKWDKYRSERGGAGRGMVSDFVIDLVPFLTTARGCCRRRPDPAEPPLKQQHRAAQADEAAGASTAARMLAVPHGGAAPGGDSSPAIGDGSTKHATLSNRRSRKLFASAALAASSQALSGEDGVERPANGRSPPLSRLEGGGGAGGAATTSGEQASLLWARRGSDSAATAVHERAREISQLQSELAARVAELCALAEGGLTEEELQRGHDLGVDASSAGAGAAAAAAEEAAAAVVIAVHNNGGGGRSGGRSGARSPAEPAAVGAITDRV